MAIRRVLGGVGRGDGFAIGNFFFPSDQRAILDSQQQQFHDMDSALMYLEARLGTTLDDSVAPASGA